MQLKHKCNNCKLIVDESEWLMAIHPFINNVVITGCPKCLEINSFVQVCDEEGCVRDATCGSKSGDLYRVTCYDHRPKDRDGD